VQPLCFPPPFPLPLPLSIRFALYSQPSNRYDLWCGVRCHSFHLSVVTSHAFALVTAAAISVVQRSTSSLLSHDTLSSWRSYVSVRVCLRAHSARVSRRAPSVCVHVCGGEGGRGVNLCALGHHQNIHRSPMAMWTAKNEKQCGCSQEIQEKETLRNSPAFGLHTTTLTCEPRKTIRVNRIRAPFRVA
jgi:hypothetical protein